MQNKLLNLVLFVGIGVILIMIANAPTELTQKQYNDLDSLCQKHPELVREVQRRSADNGKINTKEYQDLKEMAATTAKRAGLRHIEEMATTQASTRPTSH